PGCRAWISAPPGLARRQPGAVGVALLSAVPGAHPARPRGDPAAVRCVSLRGQYVRWRCRRGPAVPARPCPIQRVGLEYWVRLRCLRILVDQAAEDRTLTDPPGGCRHDVGGRIRWSLVQ